MVFSIKILPLSPTRGSRRHRHLRPRRPRGGAGGRLLGLAVPASPASFSGPRSLVLQPPGFLGSVFVLQAGSNPFFQVGIYFSLFFGSFDTTGSCLNLASVFGLGGQIEVACFQRSLVCVPLKEYMTWQCKGQYQPHEMYCKVLIYRMGFPLISLADRTQLSHTRVRAQRSCGT